MSLRMLTLASQLFSLETQLEWLQAQYFPQTASGKFLDYHAELRGIKRRGETFAAGRIRFSIPAPREQAVAIPLGSVCVSMGGTSFVTTADGEIQAGNTYCEVPAQAELPGVSGNVSAGSIIYMSHAPTGVTQCMNPAAFVGGEDAESDESLRSRIVSSYKRLPNGTNAAFYENQVIEFPGVGGVAVVPKARGRGTVDIYVSSTEGMPSVALLSDIQSKLSTVREICVDLRVLAPTPTTVNIALGIQPEAGYSFDNARTDTKPKTNSIQIGKGVVK